MRTQTTLRLSAGELATLDAAARRLHLDRAALIRSAALSVAELILARTRPLVLAAEPAAVLRRAADSLERAAGAGEP